MITNRQKAVLHVAKAKLGLSDEDYRATLMAVAGVDSSTKLTPESFGAVMDHLRARGFDYAQKVPAGVDQVERASEDKRRLLQKIRSQLVDLDLPWAYADGVAKRACKVDKALWCDPEGLCKIIAALHGHQKRKKETGQWRVRKSHQRQQFQRP